jgi:hypothetical protein
MRRLPWNLIYSNTENYRGSFKYVAYTPINANGMKIGSPGVKILLYSATASMNN